METFDFAGSWHEITCMIPVYVPDKGNCSEIWLSSGAKIQLPVKVDSLVKSLAKAFAVDLKALKQIQRQIVNKGKLVPLPINTRLVLIPIKTRDQMLSGDGTIGYVVYRYIDGFEAIKAEQYKSSIILTSGQSLKTCHTFNTLDERTHQAELVLRHYRQLFKLSDQDSNRCAGGAGSSSCQFFSCPFAQNNSKK